MLKLTKSANSYLKEWAKHPRAECNLGWLAVSDCQNYEKPILCYQLLSLLGFFRLRNQGLFEPFFSFASSFQSVLSIRRTQPELTLLKFRGSLKINWIFKLRWLPQLFFLLPLMTRSPCYKKMAAHQGTEISGSRGQWFQSHTFCFFFLSCMCCNCRQGTPAVFGPSRRDICIIKNLMHSWRVGLSKSWC